MQLLTAALVEALLAATPATAAVAVPHLLTAALAAAQLLVAALVAALSVPQVVGA